MLNLNFGGQPFPVFSFLEVDGCCAGSVIVGTSSESLHAIVNHYDRFTKTYSLFDDNDA